MRHPVVTSFPKNVKRKSEEGIENKRQEKKHEKWEVQSTAQQNKNCNDVNEKKKIVKKRKFLVNYRSFPSFPRLMFQPRKLQNDDSTW